MTSETSGTSRAACAALGIVLLSALTAACGAGGDTGAVATTTPSTSESLQAPQAQQPAAAQPGAAAPQAGTAATKQDRLAPSSYRPVVRKGKAARPTVTPTTRNVGTARSVAYRDGVSVKLTKVSQSVEKGQGPGVFPGRPHTALTLTVVNRSSRALDLNQVVVTALYGSPARLASPVYEDAAARDFTGTVKPGASATAVYVFSVPTTATRSVVAIVDFDAVHVAARVKAGK
jgi:hypothetical protein